MKPFSFDRAKSARTAREAVVSRGADAAFLAGGTTLVDLMKLDVEQPAHLVDIRDLAGDPRDDLRRIEISRESVHLGALVSMSEAIDHPQLAAAYPVITQSLMLAASAQLRNMATLGGNVLQRTRCPYFRDISFAACNKREPGSGCAALQGVNRQHAILGGSERCVATYPGDFAQALIALDARVRLSGPEGEREIAFSELHRKPGDTPQTETVLRPHELITGYTIAAMPWARRSRYVKVRDRASYAFALASAAVALDIANGKVSNARIALGGVATVPWRSQAAEQALIGKSLDENSARHAAEIAFQSARPLSDNAYKVPLGKETLVRALLETASLEI